MSQCTHSTTTTTIKIIINEWLSSTTQIRTNVCEDVGEKAPLCTIGGNCCGNQYGGS
jgi:hypothetical protein